MTGLTLGSVVFQGFEIPERINGLGGEQALVVHKLVGGARIIDAMGADDAAKSWSGRFRGISALGRARSLDALRRAGAPVALAFGPERFTVVIRSFTYDVERLYEVPYAIVCEVVRQVTSTTGPGVDEMVRADLASAQDLGGRIADGNLTGLLGSLDGAIGRVSNFARSAQSVLASVLSPIQAVQGRVTTLIAQAENTMLSVSSLGGILPNNPLARLTGQLTSQASAVSRVANLYDLQAVTGRMAGNIGAIGASGAQVVAAGGDLYRMAADAYGDAAEWTTIAKANGMTDPVIAGVKTILVPPTASGADGVLQP